MQRLEQESMRALRAVGNGVGVEEAKVNSGGSSAGVFIAILKKLGDSLG